MDYKKYQNAIDLRDAGRWLSVPGHDQEGRVKENMNRYAVVLEKAESNWAAYVPDLPGCVSTGATIEETKRNIREAIELHLETMQQVGEPIPPPTSEVSFIELETPA